MTKTDFGLALRQPDRRGDPPGERRDRDKMRRGLRIPGYRQGGGEEPQQNERKMRYVGRVYGPCAGPKCAGDERDRERAARSGQRCRGERAHGPQQHAGREIIAEVIHLADEGNGGAEDDGADTGGEIGENRPPVSGEPGANAVSSGDAGEQDGKARRTSDFHPVRRDKGQKRGRDQQTADNPDNNRNVDARVQRDKRIAHGVADRRRDHALRLPTRKVGFKALPVRSFKHPLSFTPFRVSARRGSAIARSARTGQLVV